MSETDRDGSPGPTPTERRLDELLCAALDREPEARAAFLEEACGDDDALRRGVEALLDAATEEDTIFRPGGAVRSSLLSELEQAVHDGDEPLLERFRLVREIGRGGMGVVYLAERVDGQFDQRVAVKFLPIGAGEAALARFARERQILASLEHPGIARLIDGGVTAGGRSFLVMEYVDGVSIDRFCVEERLGLEARLALLVEVCEAVQAAHRQLVIHRDLKPSNILVTAEGRIKLLDFGIAKLSEQDAAETRTRERALTPQYASPEQIRRAPVTVASDVYQVGLLAYELLTGRRPYDLSGSGPVEAERRICEVTPDRPSLVLSRTDPRSPGLTVRASELEGDIDTIVTKALRKEPERRYGSIDQLREDLERFLDGRPVSARPDTWRYRTGKFVGRHRLGVTAAAVVLLLVVSLVTAFTWRLARERDQTRLEARRAEAQRVVADEARAEAEEVVGFLIDLFEASNPYTEDVADPDTTARELLDRGAERVRSEFSDRPLLRARLLYSIAQTYRRLELFEVAEELLTEALELQRSVPGDHRLALAASLQELGSLSVERWHPEAAGPALEESSRLYSEVLGPEDPHVAVLLVWRGDLLARQGRYTESERLLRQGVDLLETHPAPEPSVYPWAVGRLAATLLELGQTEEAGELFRRRVALARASHAPEFQIATATQELARFLNAQGRYEEAIPLYEEVVGIFEERMGPEAPSLARVLNNLAMSHNGLGDNERTIELLTRALEITERNLGPEHEQYTRQLFNLASMKAEVGDFAGAEADLERLRETQLRILTPSHRQHGYTLLVLGDVAWGQGRVAEAGSYYEASRAHVEEHMGPESRLLSWPLLGLARVAGARGSLGEAVALAGRAVAIRRATMSPDSPEVRGGVEELAGLLRGAGRSDEADALEAELPPAG